MPHASLEDRRIYCRAHRLANLEIFKKREHAQYIKHRDQRLAYGRTRYYENLEQERERSRRRRREHPEKVAVTSRKQLLKMYRLTPEQYSLLLQSQDNRCAICRGTAPGVKGKRWHIDHDHSTKVVRGILCYRCNLMIGFGRDEPHIFRAAALYLQYARDSVVETLYGTCVLGAQKGMAQAAEF